MGTPVSDYDRPLKRRGIKDAKLIGSKLKELNLPIDAVFTSYANRAYHTCALVSKKLELPFEMLQIVEDLYDFSGESALRFIKSQPREINNLVVFGHNHAFTTLANQLGNRYIENIPTAGVVVVTFPVKEWSQINQGITEQTLFPKNFRS